MDNYGQLRTEVADWLNREDQDDKIPIFIRLAETEIYRNLRCQDNEFIATYNQTEWNINGGTPIAQSPGEFKLLPPNFSEIKLVRWGGVPLAQVSDQQLFARLAMGYDAGAPAKYCISGRKFFFSDEIPDDPASWAATDLLEYSYYGTESLCSLPTWRVAMNPVENPPIEDTNAEGLDQSLDNTTRLFQRNPDMYLHGALYYGCLFLKDDKYLKQWSALFKAALEDIRLETSLGMVSGSSSVVSSVYGD